MDSGSVDLLTTRSRQVVLTSAASGEFLEACALWIFLSSESPECRLREL